MTSGRYGRMRIGRCVRVDFGFVGCSTDVIDVLDRHCSGRRDCRLRIPDPEMDERRPCLSDLTRYLEASYRCVPGLNVQLSPFTDGRASDYVLFTGRSVLELGQAPNEKFGKTGTL